MSTQSSLNNLPLRLDFLMRCLPQHSTPHVHGHLCSTPFVGAHTPLLASPRWAAAVGVQRGGTLGPAGGGGRHHPTLLEAAGFPAWCARP